MQKLHCFVNRLHKLDKMLHVSLIFTFVIIGGKDNYESKCISTDSDKDFKDLAELLGM